MNLVSSFLELVQQVSPAMTAPTFDSFGTVLTGWVFARRRKVTKMILAADAVEKKHHSAFHRVFASTPWSLDELGQDRRHGPGRAHSIGRVETWRGGVGRA